MTLHKCLLIPTHDTIASHLYWGKFRITSEKFEVASDLLSYGELLLSWYDVFVRDI